MDVVIAATPAPESLVLRLFEPGDRMHPVFKAENGETWWESETELWLGVGKSPGVAGLHQTIRMLMHRRKDRWPAVVSLDAGKYGAENLEALITGVFLGGYSLQLYKSDPDPVSPLFGTEGKLVLIMPESSPEREAAVFRSRQTALTQLRIMDLMNRPGNKKKPGELAGWVVRSGAEFGYDVNVLEKEALQREGLHALLAVNQGSAEPPVLVIARYEPPQYNKTIALVGKGVTFDTGGISVKAAANMHLMKSDMGGAAAVWGTVELAARLKLPIRVIGVVPVTENAIDGASVKPGDVIASYAGKTIEVIDTDAEGRLLLADGLSYAIRNYQPDVLIDLATLTGSVIQTLGYHAAGLFTPSDALAKALEKAAEATGERVWRLPLWEVYDEEIASEIADVKNFHGKPLAGAIVAAKFLEAFTEAHPQWAHLDIAGVAFGDTAFFPGRAGTAYGIRLLRNYLEQELAGDVPG